MPKIKTSRGAAKRFKATKSGRIKRKYSFARHYLTAKSAKRKRHLRGLTDLADSNVAAVETMLPYR